jgi:hypothetical protein
LGPWAFREVFYPSSGPGGYLSPTRRDKLLTDHELEAEEKERALEEKERTLGERVRQFEAARAVQAAQAAQVAPGS